MFVLDAHAHTMTVLRDDGPYRHLRFATPGTRMYAYDLITWPGSLCFQGDYGTWVFSRQEDMFAFFAQDTGDINPGYWAEKVTAGNTRELDEETGQPGFRFQYLWACFAIRHGVNRYRAHRIERADPTAVAIYPALATPPVHRQPDPVRLAPAPPARRAVRWETRQPSEEYL